MKAYIRKRRYGLSIEASEITPKVLKEIKEILLKNNINVIEPVLPNEIIFSEKISLDKVFDRVPEKFKSSGVYRIYFDDELIYIGSSDCDGNIKGKRQGMWGRRYDFKSTLLEKPNARYKCAATEIKKHFYDNKMFPESDLCRITHDFFECHPDLARKIEFTLQGKYYEKHSKMPLLNQVDNYVGGAKKLPQFSV